MQISMTEEQVLCLQRSLSHGSSFKGHRYYSIIQYIKTLRMFLKMMAFNIIAA